MSKRDYYEVLGLTKGASEKDIKKAYRNLAKEHHPDIGGEEEKFKEISEAYDILSDKDKKTNYDRYGHRPEPSNHGFNGGMAEAFSRFHQQYNNRQRTQKGQSIRLNVKLTLEEIYTGVDKRFKFKRSESCDECNGVGGHDVSNCQFCGGSGFITETIQTPVGIIQNSTHCFHCGGTGQSYKNICKKCTGQGVIQIEDEVHVRIPAGVNDGDAMIVDGKGNAIKNGVPGDVIVVITQLKHNDYVRIASDLRYVKNLTYPEAILGINIEVPTIEGGKIKLDVPPNSNDETILRLRDKGMTSMVGNRGDLLIQIHVDMPKEISDEERELLEKIKEIHEKVEK